LTLEETFCTLYLHKNTKSVKQRVKITTSVFSILALGFFSFPKMHERALVVKMAAPVRTLQCIVPTFIQLCISLAQWRIEHNEKKKHLHLRRGLSDDVILRGKYEKE
jgi:hypothetical protein